MLLKNKNFIFLGKNKQSVLDKRTVMCYTTGKRSSTDNTTPHENMRSQLISSPIKLSIAHDLKFVKWSAQIYAIRKWKK